MKRITSITIYEPDGRPLYSELGKQNPYGSSIVKIIYLSEDMQVVTIEFENGEEFK